jgi:hypothetical protein
MRKIGIIGLGKIGSQLAFEILKDNFISEIQIFNRNKNKTKALILSLEIAAVQYEKNITIKEIDFNNINTLDLIIISVKELYDPRIKLSQNEFPDWFPKNLRYCGFFDDFPIVKSIAKKISDYNGIVAVITNPVELMTKCVADSINSKQVFGLGSSLDSSRLSYVLGKYFGAKTNLTELLLFGEHGNNFSTITNLLPTRLKNNEYSDAINQSSIIGFELVKKMGYTLFDCIPTFINDIKWLLGIINNNEFRSFSYPSSNIIISHPLRFNFEKNEFEMFSDYTNDESSKIFVLNKNLISLYDKLTEEINAAVNKR